jgi:hypothetical protein
MDKPAGFAERQHMRALLPTLSPAQRAAFAAACAERVLPLINDYYGQSVLLSEAQRCAEGVDLAWRFATGDGPSDSEVQQVVAACEALIDDLYENDETGFPMYAVKSALGAALSVTDSADGPMDAVYYAQDASVTYDVDHADDHVREEAAWQMKALDVVRATPTPARDMFKHLASPPQWLDVFRRSN